MKRRDMTIRLTADQARELNLPEDHEYVRAAFYLGLPYIVIQNRVQLRVYAEERRDTIETAELLGLRDTDRVVY